MVYIRLKENDEIKVRDKNITKLQAFLESTFNKIKVKFTKLQEEKIDNKVLITIQSVDNKTLNKLSKYLRAKCITRVCLSDNLLLDNNFLEFIKKENIKFFDGKWLYKYLNKKVLDYIVIMKKEKLDYQEISILSNQLTEVLVQNIRDIAPNVRLLNIITSNESRFRKIEKELYEEKGIILNMNNNYKKSLMKSDIIFNYDFTEEEFNKYSIPKKTVIVNFSSEIPINSKGFEGINSSFYEIQFPRKYLKNSISFKGFNSSILYESYIYKNTNPLNIKKEIHEDDVSITFLIGKNGRIRKTEYLNLSKKMVN